MNDFLPTDGTEIYGLTVIALAVGAIAIAAWRQRGRR